MEKIFRLNEAKVSDTGPNYDPRIYIDSVGGTNPIVLNFVPGTDPEEIEMLAQKLHELVSTYQLHVPDEDNVRFVPECGIMD